MFTEPISKSDFTFGSQHNVEDKDVKRDVNEVEKTDEDRYIIAEFNKYLKEELASLGLNFETISEDQIILLNPDDYDNIAIPGSRGSFMPGNKFIYLKNIKGVSRYHALLHEMIHKTSYQSFADSTDNPRIERLGYHVYKKENKEDKLMGFNDGVTELFTGEILSKHKEELLNNLDGFKDKSPVAKEREDDFFRGNRGDGAMVEMLIVRMSQKTQQSTEEIWKNFKKGLITGNMLYLKDIERVFGEGSLEILSKSGTNNQYSRRNSGLVYDYFFYDDPVKRDEIKAELLRV